MSDLDDLARDFDLAADRTTHETQQVLSKAGVNMTKDWKQKARTFDHAPRLWRTISYDVNGLTVEVGPTLGHSGSLGGIYEYGTVNNAPQPAGAPALKAEEPRFEAALSDMGERLSDGR